MTSKFVRCVVLAFGIGWGLAAATARAQDQEAYVDSLVNGWESYGWASLNYANASPVHGGARSVSVTATAWQAIYLHHAAFSTNGLQYLSFWIHGGTQGGQRLQVQALLNGVAQAAVPIGPLPANSWSQIRIALSQLGVAGASNMDGFWIQDITGTTQPTWYLDDVRLEAVAAPSSVTISVAAANRLRAADNRMFGVNAAVWDSAFDTTTTVQYLAEAQTQILRFPGGSLSDEYHWLTNTTLDNTWTWATSFDKFAHAALLAGSQAFITVNYGTGTSVEAADWVRYSNVSKGYGFKYWEIGNENYGAWEADAQTRPHDAWTYANRARDYIVAMRAVDPTIKVGVVAITGEDSYANYTDHPATNLRTGQPHNGWTAVMLARLRELGVTPDFIVHHRYAQGPGAESDQGLLQGSASWTNDAADLRQQLADYLGANGATVELVATENNSVYTSPGKQSTSLVNGLFYADSLAQALQTEFKGLVWWDLRNGQEAGNNNAASLYGWRVYGDYGMVSPSDDRYPSYYAFKLTRFFARGGDTIVQASSDYSLLAAYAALRQDGTLALMVINKSPSATLNANVAISGYTPKSAGIAYSYGIAQDEAARTGVGSPDVAQASFTASATFSRSFAPYSVTVLALAPDSAPPPPPPPPPAVPAAPTSLAAVAASGTAINLAWTDNASNETGYKVERSTNGTAFTQIAVLGANVKTYSATGLKKNALYYFRVRATNGAGDSGYSNTASATTLKR